MKKLILSFILLFGYLFAQEINVQSIEPKQVPSKYAGNGQYKTQGALLLDGNKSTYPQPYWGTSSPLIYDLDLGSIFDVSNIKIWDFEGGGVIRVYVGSTNNWQQVGSVDLNSYNEEKTISIGKSTRYIRIEIDGKVSYVKVNGSGGGGGNNGGGSGGGGNNGNDTDVNISLIEIAPEYAKIDLSNLEPENKYVIAINGKDVGEFNTPKKPNEPKEFPHVVHISIDGLRSDIVENNLDVLDGFRKLVENGSYTFSSRTDPGFTVTNPNHVGMWTGLFAQDHGVTSNNSNPPPLPSDLNTVFTQVKKEGGNSSAYVAKNKLGDLIIDQPTTLERGNDESNFEKIYQNLNDLSNYTFWHISTPDDIGHKSGWESVDYLEGLGKVDEWILKLVNGLPPDVSIVITSDHGGTQFGHGTASNKLNYTVPTFIYNTSLDKSRELFSINKNLSEIYNGETGNLSLNLLGMNPIEGSELNNPFSLCWDCDTIPTQQPLDVTQLPFDQFVGTNVLADDPADLVKPVAGNIRIYQYLKWLNNDVSNANLNAPLSQVKINFNPNDAFGFNHDASTKSFSDLGETYITLFESAMYLTQNDKTWLNAVAYNRADGRGGLDNPNRWKYVAHLYFQVAARYGHEKVDPSKLITDSEKLSGLGYCHIIEGGNEKDRWWIGKDKADLSPEEHAAYYSAIFDGHMNTMQESGVTFGVRNADPNMQVMLGGLAFVDFDELLQTGKVEWFERFFKWFEDNRTNPNYPVYPVDIIAYHDYPNTERKQRNLSGRGLHPEGYKWYEKTRAFVEYLGKRCPKPLKVINNEFGYDRNQGSPQRAEPYGGFNAEQVAGMWTVRCMLEAWAGGLYSAAQFYFRENGGGGGIFQSSGLTDKNNGYKPFQMYYYFAQIRDALKDHEFVSRRTDGDVIIYETKNRLNGKKGFVIWYGTTSNKKGNYSLTTGNGSFEYMPMKDNALKCDRQNANPQGGKINVPVWEYPSFIIEK